MSSMEPALHPGYRWGSLILLYRHYSIIEVVWLVLVLAFVYKALAFLIRRTLRAKLTAVDDISLLGRTRRDGLKIQGAAVICGGSIAGLMSARICADHFERVLIIEPEAWVATDEGLHDRHRDNSTPQSNVPKRSRVAQYTSLHVYQSFTTRALRKLFSDSDSQLKRAGARIMPADPAIHISGIPLQVPHHKYAKQGLPEALFFSRPGYETVLRKMVLSTCSNVKYVTGAVSGLTPKTVNAVGSVRVRAHVGVGAVTEIPAVLVVDCTGAARGGLRWLQDSFSPADPRLDIEKKSLPLSELKTTYDPKMSYTSCQFEIPSDLLERIRTVVLPRSYETDANIYTYLPDSSAEGNTLLISRREGNYLDMLCGGWNFRGRMTSITDIKDYVSKLQAGQPIPRYVFALLDLLEMENVPATYVHSRVPPPVYVQYTRAAQLPSNFVAVGDSVLQLNPVRGQGCTKACMDAVTLNALLARTRPVHSKFSNTESDELPKNFARTFFAMQAKRTGSIWEAHKSADYAWCSTVPTPGEDPKTYGKWMRWYVSRVTTLAIKDREAASIFWHVTNFLEPPTDLFSPGIVIKVLWTQLIQSMAHAIAKAWDAGL